MKNFKKQISLLLTVVPMLSNVGMTKAMNEVDKNRQANIENTNINFKPDTNKEVRLGGLEQDEMNNAPTRENSVVGDEVAEDTLEKETEMLRKMQENAPANLDSGEKNFRADMVSDIGNRLSEAQENAFNVINSMNEENYSSFTGSEYTDMLSSMQRVQDELGILANSMTDINKVLNSSDRFKVNKTILSMDKSVKSLEDLVNDTKDRAWPKLKEDITRYEQRKKQFDDSKKSTLIKSCNIQCRRIRNVLGNLENSLQTAVNMDPTMDALYAHIRESAKGVVNGLNRLESQLSNASSLNVLTLQSMQETAKLYEDTANKLKDDFGKIQARSNSDSYANVLTDLGTRVVKTEMSCENLTRMNIRKRIMSDSQRQSLLQVKEELKKLFDSMKQEIQKVRDSATASRSLSKAMPNNVRRRLEDLVSETLGEAADHLRSWRRTVSAIESDDELRLQWDPHEMHRIMKQRMTNNCYDILTNNSWNINKKVKSIVAEINNVQPGTGTMVESVVRGILEYLSKGTPLTAFGEAVRGNLAGRSWLFTGEGGTGKSTAVELLAAAFNVKLISINGGDLRDSTKVTRILRDLIALTKPQANPENLVNFMVLLDEVDTGVCVATDSRGRSLELEGGNNVLPDADGYDEDNAEPAGRYAEEDAVPMLGRKRVRQSTKWKMKASKVRNKEAKPLENSKKAVMDTALMRNPGGFRALSSIYNLLDSNTQSNMWGFFSTSNFNRQVMPEEVARRLSPDTHEVAFRKPLKKEFIDIINKKMPNLSFSDGYDKAEGAAKIAEQAEKKGMSAAELLSTITPIADSVRKPGDTGCALPAVGICRLISGTITEGELVADARRLNNEEESNKNAGAAAVITNEETFDDPAIAKPYEDNLRTFAPGVRMMPPQS